MFLWQCSIVGHNWGHSEVGYLRPLHVPTSQSSCRITVSMFSTPSLQFAFSVCLWDQRKGYITFTINSNVNLMLSSAAAAWHKANKYYCFYYLPRENIRKLSSLHPPFHILPTPTPPRVFPPYASPSFPTPSPRNLLRLMLALSGGERRQSLQEYVHTWNVKYWNCIIKDTMWSPTLMLLSMLLLLCTKCSSFCFFLGRWALEVDMSHVLWQTATDESF